jgi:predicted  nucleic acid-binding Zn-ribbon protein
VEPTAFADAVAISLSLPFQDVNADIAGVKAKIASLEQKVVLVEKQLKDGRDDTGQVLSRDEKLALNNQLSALNNQVVELQREKNLLLERQQRAGGAGLDANSAGQSDVPPFLEGHEPDCPLPFCSVSAALL